MLGIFTNTSASRSKNMRAIRSRGNRSTELRLRAALVQRGIKGWCLHSKDVPGVPDFFFACERIAVFVDGCFWHGCPRCGHIPKTNVDYWQKKINRNKARDHAVTTALSGDAFEVIRIWECEIRSNIGACAEQILKRLQSRSKSSGPE